jgi:hypothetical protein
MPWNLFVRKIKSSYLLENTLTGDKTWVSSTNQKQNAEFPNRSHALTWWKMCEYQNQRSKLWRSAFILKDSSIMNLFLQKSETNDTNLEVLKCLHSMLIKQMDSTTYFSTKQFFCFMLPKLKIFMEGLIFKHLWIFRGMYW